MLKLQFIELGKKEIKEYLNVVYPTHIALNPIIVKDLQNKMYDLNKKMIYISENLHQTLYKYFPENLTILKKLEIAYSFNDLVYFINKNKNKEVPKSITPTLPIAYLKLGKTMENHLIKLKKLLIQQININENKKDLNTIITNFNNNIHNFNTINVNQLSNVYYEKFIYITDSFFKTEYPLIAKLGILLHELAHLKHNIYGSLIEHVTSKIKELVIEQENPVQFILYNFYLNIYFNFIADYFANRDVYREMKNKKIIKEPSEIFPKFFVDRQFMLDFVLNNQEIYNKPELTFQEFLEYFYFYFMETIYPTINIENLNIHNIDSDFLNSKKIINLQKNFENITPSCLPFLNNSMSLINDIIINVFKLKNTLYQKLSNKNNINVYELYPINNCITNIIYTLISHLNKNNYCIYKELGKTINIYKNIQENIHEKINIKYQNKVDTNQKNNINKVSENIDKQIQNRNIKLQEGTLDITAFFN
jgi:hypothetical protein